MNFSHALDDLSLAALKRDCRATQERVYRTFAPAAWTLAVRLSGCEAQAWDAVQAGFVRAFEKAGQLRQPELFGPWLRRIVVNQVMDLNRNRFEALAEHEPADPQPSHDAGQLDLERALNRLDVVDRTVLWLHDAEGMTHSEIADLAGQSVSWSKSRLSRARTKIRPLLEAESITPAVRTADHAR
ncbi:MAG: RNA polymerase sigma factor [Wenzhouxiangella sp.]